MSDPLTLLREFTVNSQPYQLYNLDGELVDALEKAHTVGFNGQKFQKNVKTSLRKKGQASSDTSDPDASYHTLDSLIYYISNKDVDFFKYVKSASDIGVTPVSFVEKKTVLDYLTGALDHVEAVDTKKASVVPAAPKPEIAPESTTRSTSGLIDHAAVRKIASCQRVLRTRFTLLRGSKPYLDIKERALEVLSQKKHHPSASAGTPGRPGDSKSKAVADTRSPVSTKDARHHPYARSPAHLSKEKRIPIIVVPAAMTALLTMYNIKDFLEKQQFISSNEIKEAGVPKPPLIAIKRQSSPHSPPVIYHVVDSTEKFKPGDWDRVACVMTNGASWQFRGWKWSSPNEVFHNVKGYYVKYVDEKAKESALKWKVDMLNIHRTKRHADRATVTQFWDALDSYMASVKPHLLPGKAT